MSNTFDMSELTAALNNHEVTDANGEVQESENVETPVEEPVASESEPQVDDTQETVEAPLPEVAEDLVEDESTGKRFVPEDRFKKIYGEKKRLERELESFKTAPKDEVPFVPSVPSGESAVETELLYVAMPEFNPSSDKYSKTLDTLGANIYKANPGITKLEAARRAKALAKELSTSQEAVRSEAKQIKLRDADGSMASRTQRRTETVNPDNMTDRELEAYLRATGQW